MASSSTRLTRLLFRTRLRLDLGLFVRLQMRALSPLLFLLGAWIILRARIAPELAPTPGESLGIILALSAVAAFALWVPRRWKRAECAHDLDREFEAGGLLLTLNEVPDERWAPFVDWKTERKLAPVLDVETFLPLVPGLLFALLSLAVPVQKTSPSPAVAVGHSLVTELETRLQGLESSGLLREESAGRLREELQRLDRTIEGGEFGAAQWEAVEAIRRRMSGEENQGIVRLQEVASKLQAAGLLDPKRLRELDDASARQLVDAALDAADDLGLKIPALARGLVGSTLSRVIKDAQAGDVEGLKKRAEAISGLFRNELGSLIPNGLRGFLRPGGGGSAILRSPGALKLLPEIAKAPEKSPDQPQLAAPGDLIHRHQLRPRHRGVVSRYFSER